MSTLGEIGKALGEAIQGMGTYSAQAAAQANNVSKQAQSAQGAFNQQSANIANSINDLSMANQYAFNSAQASSANAFTENMWQRTADWNEAMWERQAEFNAEQAQIQRDWQERMANTQYQRAIKDMSAAGLNPILAVTGGGVGTGVPGGATASVGGASMGSAQGAMASGGLLGANSASESNYMGQMEYMSGLLGCVSAIFNGFASATEAAGSAGDFGEELLDSVAGFFDKDNTSSVGHYVGELYDNVKEGWEYLTKTGRYKNSNAEHAAYKNKNKSAYTSQPVRVENTINGKKMWFFNKPLK